LRDITLLLNYIYANPSMRNTETWTPLTIPGIQEDAILCVYINYLTPNFGLIVVCNDSDNDIFFDC